MVMRCLMKLNWPDNFEEIYRQQGQHKHGIRLLALWKLQSGLTEKAVCEFLGKTPKTIRMWRRLYESDGLEGLLHIRAGRGRKPLLPLLESIKEDITSLQDKREGGRVKCKDIVEMVAQKYAVRYSQSGMYHILDRIGFSWMIKTSKAKYTGSGRIQKKTSLTLLYSFFLRMLLYHKSTFGFRMKHVSDNKDL